MNIEPIPCPHCKGSGKTFPATQPVWRPSNEVVAKMRKDFEESFRKAQEERQQRMWDKTTSLDSEDSFRATLFAARLLGVTDTSKAPIA